MFKNLKVIEGREKGDVQKFKGVFKNFDENGFYVKKVEIFGKMECSKIFEHIEHIEWRVLGKFT